MIYTTYGKTGISIDGEGFSEAELRKMIFPEMDADESRSHVYPVGGGRYHVVSPVGALVDFRWATRRVVIGTDDVRGLRIRVDDRGVGSPTSLASYTYREE